MLLQILNDLSLLQSILTILVNCICINCIFGPVQFIINVDAWIITVHYFHLYSNDGN